MKKTAILKYSLAGNMPPRGDLEEAEAILAFPFGYIADKDGNYLAPGSTNIALANHIAHDPLLREKDIVLSEELADALDGRTDGSITLLSNFEHDKAGTSYDYAKRAKKLEVIADVGILAVVAFRNHLPRAATSTEKIGFNIAVPDMRSIGDFDSLSAQWWTRNQKLWTLREMAVVPYSALAKQI